jgi:type IV secretion system protein VirD4
MPEPVLPQQARAWLRTHADDLPKIIATYLLGFLLPTVVLAVVCPKFSIVADNLGAKALAAGFAAWFATECVLHVMGWAGRRFRPRLWLWRAITAALCAVIVLVVLAANADNYTQAAKLFSYLSRYVDQHPQKGSFLYVLYHGVTHWSLPYLFQAWLSLWVLAALLKFTLIVTLPDRWADFRQFAWLILCGVTVAGYPLGAIVYAMLGTVTASWWLGLLCLVLPVLLPFGGIVTLAAIGMVLSAVVGVVFFLLVGLPLHIYDWLRLREIAHIERDHKKRDLGRYVARFYFWLAHETPPEIPDDGKGSRFATAAEVDRARGTWEKLSSWMTFGWFEGAPLLLETDKHVLVQGSTRSGKGVTIIIPHLLRYIGSAFVLDPKGENAKATGRRREQLNDEVHYLDPFGISGKRRSRFNPLSRFTLQNMEAESKALAAALFASRERDHWTAAAQQLLAALILYVFTSVDIPAAKKDLVTVRRLLLAGVMETLKAMIKSDVANGLLADLANSFLKTPDRELGSIISSAQRETEILDNPFIAACLSAAGDGPEVDFSAWHRGTMSVFLCLSAPKFPVFNRWLRLVLTAALDEMTDRLEPPPLPVCFMLDELATLGHLAPVENAVGLAAGYGVQLITVFQDVAQMKDLYKGRWASMVGNAGIRVLFNLDDYETARYWSEFIGGRLTETLSQSQNIYGITEHQTAGETVRPLITPEEIMLRYSRSGTMLVLKQGMRPIEAERVAYFNDPTLIDLWDDPRVTPAPAPQSANSPWA